MNLTAVATILEDAGVGTIGKSIFINMMPPDAPGILLRQYFGGTRIDHELPGYRKTTFMLIARANEYTEGEALINDAVKALTIEISEEKAGVYWNYMRPETEPFVYAESPGAAIEFQVNIDACYVLM